MSMLLMVQAMRARVGNPLRKLVLIKLADNANDEGESWAVPVARWVGERVQRAVEVLQ